MEVSVGGFDSRPVHPYGAYMASTDEDLRALGYFVYQFSRTVKMMRARLPEMSMHDLAPQPDVTRRVREALELHTGDMNPDHLANVFFAVAELVAGYDDHERKVAKALRSSLDPYIEIRNDFMHGEWAIGYIGTMVDGGPVERLPPSLGRTKARRSGPKTRRSHTAADEIIVVAAELGRLRTTMWEWTRLATGHGIILPEGVTVPSGTIIAGPLPEGSGVLGEDFSHPRPGDVYTLRGKQVVREGPLAARVPLPSQIP